MSTSTSSRPNVRGAMTRRRWPASGPFLTISAGTSSLIRLGVHACARRPGGHALHLFPPFGKVENTGLKGRIMRGLEAGPPQRVALVNMPFAGANRPSIQCGLLKAGLVREGHEVDVHYLNLELAAEIGEVHLSQARGPPLGSPSGRVALRRSRFRAAGRRGGVPRGAPEPAGDPQAAREGLRRAPPDAQRAVPGADRTLGRRDRLGRLPDRRLHLHLRAERLLARARAGESRTSGRRS